MNHRLTAAKGGGKGEAAPKFHTCAICGKEEPWGPSWQWFGSYAMEEVCPEDLARLCSIRCRVEFDRRLAMGVIRLPELSKRWPQRKIRDRIGY